MLWWGLARCWRPWLTIAPDLGTGFWCICESIPAAAQKGHWRQEQGCWGWLGGSYQVTTASVWAAGSSLWGCASQGTHIASQGTHMGTNAYLTGGDQHTSTKPSSSLNPGCLLCMQPVTKRCMLLRCVHVLLAASLCTHNKIHAQMDPIERRILTCLTITDQPTRVAYTKFYSFRSRAVGRCRILGCMAL